MKKHEILALIEEVEQLPVPYTPEDLKKIRASFGLSQKEFAWLLRVEKSWVTKREQGVNRMTASDTTLYQTILHMRKNKCLHHWLNGCGPGR